MSDGKQNYISPFNILNLSQIKAEAEAIPDRKKIFGAFLYSQYFGKY